MWLGLSDLWLGLPDLWLGLSDLRLGLSDSWLGVAQGLGSMAKGSPGDPRAEETRSGGGKNLVLGPTSREQIG